MLYLSMGSDGSGMALISAPRSRRSVPMQVALFSENSSRWLVADQAVMTVGAADAVRGASSPAEEMAYIVRHSQSCGIIAQDSATLERLAPALGGGASSSSNGSNGSGSHVSRVPHD